MVEQTQYMREYTEAAGERTMWDRTAADARAWLASKKAANAPVPAPHCSSTPIAPKRTTRKPTAQSGRPKGNLRKAAAQGCKPSLKKQPQQQRPPATTRPKGAGPKPLPKAPPRPTPTPCKPQRSGPIFEACFVLGIEPGPNGTRPAPKVVDKAHKALVRSIHPDRNRHDIDGATLRTTEANVARDFLVGNGIEVL